MGRGGVTIAMEFGIPREVQDLEMRAGRTPVRLLPLKRAGCAVCVWQDAGAGAGFSDADFRQADAQVVPSAADVHGRSNVVLKTTRSTDQEYLLFRSEQTIFCFLHLTAQPADLIEARKDRKITASTNGVAQEEDGPQRGLLPMNESGLHLAPVLAGRLRVSACLPSLVRLVDRGPNGDCRRCNDA
jgi:alanine dehydrogenase